ncbi:hypothetical protein [Enterocloster bolteae]|uniref:hypothetical protein n=1 Tax=Enterocloster bolteae TaxID=208479 RepID=UPI0028DB55D5|nr:hypothetical protein [Enterocloster bolteae]
MIGKVSCKNCASLDKKRKEMKQGSSGKYYYGCLVRGTNRSPIESDQELEHQSCNEWEASDEQKRENGSMAEEFEQELQVLYSRWKQIYKYGGQDSNCPDGFELNLLRERIISVKRQIARCLREQEYPSSYQLEIPSMVDNRYMAQTQEILAAALKSLRIYETNTNYQWLTRKITELSEKERNRSGIYYALGYVKQLKNAIEQKDYVLMRGHESPDYYVELLSECRSRVNQLLEEREIVKVVPARKKTDKNKEEQPQIPGQIDIFSFLAS